MAHARGLYFPNPRRSDARVSFNVASDIDRNSSANQSAMPDKSIHRYRRDAPKMLAPFSRSASPIIRRIDVRRIDARRTPRVSNNKSNGRSFRSASWSAIATAWNFCDPGSISSPSRRYGVIRPIANRGCGEEASKMPRDRHVGSEDTAQSRLLQRRVSTWLASRASSSSLRFEAAPLQERRGSLGGGESSRGESRSITSTTIRRIRRPSDTGSRGASNKSTRRSFGCVGDSG